MVTRTASSRRADPAASRPVSQEAIARVAYELYEQRGRQPGRELQDWLEAERIVRRQRRRPT
jgi:hypothetical protein